MDAAIKELSHRPDVQLFMLPLPTREAPNKNPNNNQRYQPYPSTAPTAPKGDGGKGKGKQQGKGKTGGKIQVPEGCSIKFGDNDKPICMKYNIGTCKANIKPGKKGKRCMFGYRVCWKNGCNKNAPFHECSHTGAA